MILGLFCVLAAHAQNHHKRTLQRPRPNIYLAGAKNLKGFEHLAAENELMEVGNYDISFVIPYSE